MNSVNFGMLNRNSTMNQVKDLQHRVSQLENQQGISEATSYGSTPASADTYENSAQGRPANGKA